MATWWLIEASTLVATRWRNGLGVTRDIATVLAPDGALRWQISIADLVQDAAFSRYPDCDRIFTPIAGDPPPELGFHGGPFEPCPLLVPKPFPGDIPTLSRVSAPGRAFNVVFDRRYHAAEVAVLNLGTGDPIRIPEAGCIMLHCLAGRLEGAGLALGPGDSACGDRPTPFAARTAATAILVAIR